MEIESKDNDIKKSKVLIFSKPISLWENLSMALKSKNIEIVLAEDINTAANFLKDYEIDLIITNSALGFEELEHFMKIIRKDYEIPVLMLMNSELNEDVNLFLELGASDCFTPETNINILIRRILTNLELYKYNKFLKNDVEVLSKLNEEKNELIGITVHDLKNPIDNITMLSKAMRDSVELSSDEIKEFSGDIAETAEKMLYFIKEMLNINSIDEGRVQVKVNQVDLVDSCNDIVDLYKEMALKKNIRIIKKFDTNNLIVNTDQNCINQIMDNLISNAIKYTPLNKSVYISIYEKENLAFLVVEDEGPGFTNEDMEKIFEKFTKLTAKPTGNEHSTGLGLYIVKKYCDLIGAEIQVEPNTGKGAKFIVKIPKTGNGE